MNIFLFILSFCRLWYLSPQTRFLLYVFAMSRMPQEIINIINSADTGDADALSTMLEEIYNLEKRPSEMLGEAIEVLPEQFSSKTWNYRLVGRNTANEYGAISLDAGDDLRAWAVVALTIQISFNDPWLLSDEVFHSYQELTAWPGFVCSKCDKLFPDWSAKETHALLIHGLVPFR